jgi:hypothetical protein
MKTAMALLLSTGAAQAEPQIAVSDLELYLARAITNVNYQAPTSAEFNQARELFRHTLHGDRTAADLKPAWEKLGFRFSSVVVNGEPCWFIGEPAGKEFGRGWYLLRTNSESSIALEAPHAKNDIHTGTIGLQLFLADKIRAYGAATITRRSADMAHLDDTFFQAFTLAYADVCPTGLVVQLHGFETENHDNIRADIIATAGTRSPGPWLGEWIQQTRKTSSLTILGYPHDVTELGATQNSQADALRKNGNCRFLHLELTKELRDRLTRDTKLRRVVLDSLPSAQTR